MPRSLKIIIVFTFCLVFTPMHLFAQIPLNQNLILKNNLNTDFSKQNTTWNWLAYYRIGQQLDKDNFWSLKETFKSNLITPNNSRKQWKDEHRLKGLFHSYFEYATLGLYLNCF